METNEKPQDLEVAVADVEPGSISPASTFSKATAAQVESSTIQGNNEQTQKSHGRLPVLESIGTYGCLVLSLGSLVLLGSIALLSFLWFATGSQLEAADAPRVWRSITLNDWFVQTITLVSLIIRSIVISQGIVCTSMIAGLILERRFVLQSSAAYVSVLRAINNGPHTVIQHIAKSRKAAVIMRPETALIVVLTLVSLGLQFTSTILLADISNMTVKGDLSTIQVRAVLADNQSHIPSTTGLYKQLSPQNAVFGEVESDASARPDDRGVSDTLVQQRAVLPMDNAQQRKAIRSYEGNSMVMSSRAMCMRPNISGATFKARWFNAWSDKFYGEMNGTLDYMSSIKEGGRESWCKSGDCKSLGFKCYVPGAYEGYGWQSVFCILSGIGDSFWSGDTGPLTQSSIDPLSANSTIMIVLSTNMRPEDWKSLNPSMEADQEPITHGEVRDNDEWRSYELLPDRMVNVSLCFSSWSMDYRHITLSTSGEVQEPQLDYKNGTGEPDATKIHRYFGTDSSTTNLAQREILTATDIQPLSQGPSQLQENTTLLIRRNVYSEAILATSPNWTVFICNHCVIYGQSPHPDMVVVLAQMIDRAKRPAYAIQSFLTGLFSVTYHVFQTHFTGLEDAAVATVSPHLAAGKCPSSNGCAGFASVVTLLSLHLVCVLAITALYVCTVRHSRCSDIWQAVTQLAVGDTDEIPKGIMAEIRRMFGSKGGSGSLETESVVKLRESPESGKAEISKYYNN